ncbi:succinyl-diaminopimelate desuccinylase [Thermasporomyces composti]|jgi:succinyl-diaminopimelate desuccinylase|uniref:Succinyl-diaminopimelate desuccinylase n=1 Tax=Thermasporomyces composti TaxID=696763 RepID=A0A3D9V4F1_THECX|nr:succinyl-diaminopimelate desuccinylase [Thermasporomyces composti]REF35573.1 succinyldiaminopimelate desuccinylase [Thermasporomyces composti]
MASLDIHADVATLTAALIDVESVSGNEAELADAVEAALRTLPHLTTWRFGNTVVARTELARSERVVLAGHLDTVPPAGNLPSRRVGDRVYGLGACDMKGGVAVALRLAATVTEPVRDVTYVFYDCEEIEAERNGLGRLSREHPDLLAADFAVLMEPSAAHVEGGCQGTLRADVIVRGKRAHSARAWMGENAVHKAADVLNRLTSYEPRQVPVDGLVYREGLNAVGISGGVAGNVIPDECRVTINYRFAPDRSPDEAFEHVRSLMHGYEVELRDSAPAAAPGLHRPAAAAFVAAVGGEPRPKFGWTDVARFAELGVPAVNYGPGEPQLAHTPDEYVDVDELYQCEERLRGWLAG